MKRALILLFMAVIAVSSCETLEDNSPALQATLDSVFFKAGDVLGASFSDGSVIYQGVTQDEILTIYLPEKERDTYPMGPGTSAYATYQNFEGLVYTTEAQGGSGEVTVGDRCISCGWISGDFRFTAISPNLDTIVVSKGFYFEANFTRDNLIGIETDPQNNSLVATVNGASFNPTAVEVSESQGVVTTEAVAANQAIIVQVPENALPGDYFIGDVGYAAGYRVDGGTVIAQSGSITIVSNDTAAREMVVSFSFIAGEYEVTNGSMTIYY